MLCRSVCTYLIFSEYFSFVDPCSEELFLNNVFVLLILSLLVCREYLWFVSGNVVRMEASHTSEDGSPADRWVLLIVARMSLPKVFPAFRIQDPVPF